MSAVDDVLWQVHDRYMTDTVMQVKKLSITDYWSLQCNEEIFFTSLLFMVLELLTSNIYTFRIKPNHTKQFYFLFFISEVLGLNNITTKNATNSKYWGFIIYIQAIIYMLLHNLRDSTFKTSFKLKSIVPIKTTLHLVCIKPGGGLYLPELIFLEQHLFAFCLLSPNFEQSMFSLRS